MNDPARHKDLRGNAIRDISLNKVTEVFPDERSYCLANVSNRIVTEDNRIEGLQCFEKTIDISLTVRNPIKFLRTTQRTACDY